MPDSLVFIVNPVSRSGYRQKHLSVYVSFRQITAIGITNSTNMYCLIITAGNTLAGDEASSISFLIFMEVTFDTLAVKNTTELILAAQRQGLTIQADSIEFNQSGLDFLVAYATDMQGRDWILRLPRRAEVIEKASLEANVLQLVNKQLSVAVPHWQIYTPELIAYPRLPGTPVAVIDPAVKNYIWHLDPQALPTAFIDTLAKTLVALHSIDLKETQQAGIPMLSPTQIREDLSGKMCQVKQQIGVAEPLWQQWQEWLAQDAYWPSHCALVHGDLHAAHILVSEDNQVSGLLDWTEAEVSDPAIDFVLYHAMFGLESLMVLLERYQVHGGRVWPSMHEHILQRQAFYPVSIALFALQSGEQIHMEWAKAALGLTAS